MESIEYVDYGEDDLRSGCMPADVINQPPHYTSHPSGIECIEVAEHWPFNLGNALKYIWRVNAKGKPIDNLRKARWYIDREIARVQGQSEEER